VKPKLSLLKPVINSPELKTRKVYSINEQKNETNRKRKPHTQWDDCIGEFHLAIKKQIIDR